MPIGPGMGGVWQGVVLKAAYSEIQPSLARHHLPPPIRDMRL